MANGILRTPQLQDARVLRIVNGPEAFTPDGEFILGPTEVRGFWVAAGFCAAGLAGARRGGGLAAGVGGDRGSPSGPPGRGVDRRRETASGCLGDGLPPVRAPLHQPRVHAGPDSRGLFDL